MLRECCVKYISNKLNTEWLGVYGTQDEVCDVCGLEIHTVINDNSVFFADRDAYNLLSVEQRDSLPTVKKPKLEPDNEYNNLTWSELED